MARAAGERGLQPGPTSRDGRTSPLRPPLTSHDLDAIYAALLAMYGEQQWWPAAAEGEAAQRLEICLGAILTQNTSWRGAAAAIEQLRAAGALDAAAIIALPQDVLAQLLRPSGYFNAKASKLRAFAEAVLEAGGIDALLLGDPDDIRRRLLGIWGIGRETADAITLYAARQPTFVVDAYAYRLLERLGRAPLSPNGRARDYETYRRFFLDRIGAGEGRPDVWALNEWHALLVRHGQLTCRRTAPRCDDCALLDRCEYGQGDAG